MMAHGMRDPETWGAHQVLLSSLGWRVPMRVAREAVVVVGELGKGQSTSGQPHQGLTCTG